MRWRRRLLRRQRKNGNSPRDTQRRAEEKAKRGRVQKAVANARTSKAPNVARTGGRNTMNLLLAVAALAGPGFTPQDMMSTLRRR